MILVDTSLWIDYFGKGQRALHSLLETREAAIHTFVIGELALGDLRSRETTLASLHKIKQAQLASAEDVLTLIEAKHLYGSGIGYVDMHLLASTLISPNCLLWSRDQQLAKAAHDLGVAYLPPLN